VFKTQWKYNGEKIITQLPFAIDDYNMDETYDDLHKWLTKGPRTNLIPIAIFRACSLYDWGEDYPVITFPELASVPDINKLCKISEDYNIKGKKGTYDILVLDEMSLLMNQFFSSTMDEYRHVNFETFVRLIQDTDQVIVMDALLHKVELASEEKKVYKPL